MVTPLKFIISNKLLLLTFDVSNRKVILYYNSLKVSSTQKESIFYLQTYEHLMPMNNFGYKR